MTTETTEYIKGRLLKTAARCALRERVKKVEAAVMMREAYDLIGRLEAEITSLTACVGRKPVEHFIGHNQLVPAKAEPGGRVES